MLANLKRVVQRVVGLLRPETSTTTRPPKDPHLLEIAESDLGATTSGFVVPKVTMPGQGVKVEVQDSAGLEGRRVVKDDCKPGHR
jgi:hypothetical protein